MSGHQGWQGHSDCSSLPPAALSGTEQTGSVRLYPSENHGERKSRVFVVTTAAAVAYEPGDTRDKGRWKTGIRGSAVVVGEVQGRELEGRPPGG